eukprot:1414378-Rhodomonas_salina.2
MCSPLAVYARTPNQRDARTPPIVASTGGKGRMPAGDGRGPQDQVCDLAEKASANESDSGGQHRHAEFSLR